MQVPSELRLQATAVAGHDAAVASIGDAVLPPARALAAVVLLGFVLLLVTTPPLVAAGGLGERFSTQLQPQVPSWLGTLAQLANVARLAAALTFTCLLAARLDRSQ